MGRYFVVLRLMAAPLSEILRNHCSLRMGYWCSALAFVRNCGVGPPPGFAFPVALHPYIRPVCAYQFSYAASGIMVSSFEWFGLLPRLYYCRVAIRHQCLVVSLIIEVLPISSCVAHSCGLLYYAFFFLLPVCFVWSCSGGVTCRPWSCISCTW